MQATTKGGMHLLQQDGPYRGVLPIQTIRQPETRFRKAALIPEV